MQDAAMGGTRMLGMAVGKREYNWKSVKTKENHSKSMERQIETGNLGAQIADTIVRCKDWGAMEQQLCKYVNERVHGIAPISKEEDKYLDEGFTVVGVAGLENLGVLLDIKTTRKRAPQLRGYLRKPIAKGNSGTYLGFEEGEETDGIYLSSNQVKNATFRYTRPAGWMNSVARENFIAKYNKEY